MEYTITGMKCVTTKFGNKFVITIHFKGEMVDISALSVLFLKQLILKRNLQNWIKYDFKGY